ncbi:MAG: hypothetical protein IBJ10_09895 [Phycisphaerales bacterium]|nr:hypothetical protein [Phycisphaerales bacterium]
MPGKINWKASPTDVKKIDSILDRAAAVWPYYGEPEGRKEAAMDLTACHCNGTPLDLDALLAADDFDFAHDLFGIRENINRKTGELDNCFLPRCAHHEITAH